MEQIKLVIKASDMDEDFIKKVTEVTQSAMQQFRSERQIAHHIKYEFDKYDQFGWNCIVGRNFGSHVIHQTKKTIFLIMEGMIMIKHKFNITVVPILIITSFSHQKCLSIDVIKPIQLYRHFIKIMGCGRCFTQQQLSTQEQQLELDLNSCKGREVRKKQIDQSQSPFESTKLGTLRNDQEFQFINLSQSDSEYPMERAVLRTHFSNFQTFQAGSQGKIVSAHFINILESSEEEDNNKYLKRFH